MKDRIGIVVYANPDYLPPVINTINILEKEFDLIVVCRNQDKPQLTYLGNTRLFRLGSLKTAREKEKQAWPMKAFEFISFTIRVIFYIRRYGCRLVYSYDMHGFFSGFLASYLGKKIPHIYHNLDIMEISMREGLSFLIRKFELVFTRYADKIVFPDTYRAIMFQELVHLKSAPAIVINAPMSIKKLPARNMLREILDSKGIDKNIKVLLFQGALVEKNCVLQLIHALALCPEDTILVLLGWGTEDFLESSYKLIQSLGLGKRCLHIPFVPYSELFSYTIGAYLGFALYKDTDHNKLYEAGASNKIFEYFSLGIPAVISSNAVFRRTIDESLVYFAEPYSPEGIAKAVSLALSNSEEYIRKSQACRKAHLLKYNYEEQFSKISKYIRKIMQRNKS